MIGIILVFLCLLSNAWAISYYFMEQGGIPSKFFCNSSTEWHNRAVLTSSINALAEYDTFTVENYTFCIMGGVLVESELVGVTIYLDGTLVFSVDKETWPRQREQGGRKDDGDKHEKEEDREAGTSGESLARSTSSRLYDVSIGAGGADSGPSASLRFLKG